jgi:hypothetical protein
LFVIRNAIVPQGQIGVATITIGPTGNHGIQLVSRGFIGRFLKDGTTGISKARGRGGLQVTVEGTEPPISDDGLAFAGAIPISISRHGVLCHGTFFETYVEGGRPLQGGGLIQDLVDTGSRVAESHDDEGISRLEGRVLHPIEGDGFRDGRGDGSFQGRDHHVKVHLEFLGVVGMSHILRGFEACPRDGQGRDDTTHVDVIKVAAIERNRNE